MTPEKHRELIIDEISKLVRNKYNRGVAEHGGGLWKLDNLRDEAIEEAIDLLVYLITDRLLDKKNS